MQQPSNTVLGGFRGDIQGMRAIAVLGTLVFHLGFEPFSSGFIMLDVFFVVSGFIITALLLREIDTTGHLNVGAFYLRRSRRILPAATVAIVGTVLASYLWINPIDAREAAVDGIWASLFGANIRFALDETDYFAEDDSASPFQHFWSLSVEEQFYLVLPGLLLLTLVLVRRRNRRRTGQPMSVRSAIIATVGSLTLLSFAWSIYASHVSPQSAYFSAFTRSWEFGTGALLAAVAPALVHRMGPVLRNVTGAGGLVLVFASLVLISPTDPFPGWLALLPVVGTLAVLLVGSGETAPAVSRLLGVRPMRTIGDMSYSLYLWHWPIIVVAQQRLQRELRPLDLVVVVAVTALVTVASFHLVEQPFRRGRAMRTSRALVIYPAAVSLAVAASWATTVAVDRTLHTDAPAITVAEFETRGNDLADDPAIALVQASVLAARQGDPVPGELRPALEDLKEDTADMGACENLEPPWRSCERGDPDGDRTLVLLGDSHGRHWIPALEEITRDAGWSAYYLVKPQCSAARIQGLVQGEDTPSPECADFNEWALQEVERLQPELVVVSTTGAARVYDDGEVVSDQDGIDAAVREGFRELFADLEPLTDRTTLLVDVPSRSTRPPQCLSARDATLAGCLDSPTSRRASASRVSAEVAREVGVDVVQTQQWLCADGKCPAVVGDMVVQRDTGHLTTVYARHLADALGRRLRLER